VELFDPETGTWTPIDDLNTPHALHSATLLPDGRVLVAGNGASPLDPAGQTADVELLSSPTGQWAATGELKSRREGHTATLLPGGRVLVAGGEGDKAGRRAKHDKAGRRAEVFDAATGQWVAIGELKHPRDGHTATLLPDGRVLVAGGEGDKAGRSAKGGGARHSAKDGGAGDSAEVFDPATGQWMATGELKVRRDGHTATLLPDGRVLVAGGEGDKAGHSAEVFDPATGQWAATGELKSRREGHTATLLLDGRVLVAGGEGRAGRSAEVFDRGLGFLSAWRPVLISATSPLLLGDPLLVTGEQFQGVSEASGGNSGQSSPTGYPLVQLRRLDNEQMRFLLADTWSETSFTSIPVTDFPAGHALVTVFTNAIPSISKIIRIAQP
jgi:hypothetical protein